MANGAVNTSLNLLVFRMSYGVVQLLVVLVICWPLGFDGGDLIVAFGFQWWWFDCEWWVMRFDGFFFFLIWVCDLALFIYYYLRDFPCLDSSFFLFKNAPTPLYLSRNKTKGQSGKNTTLTPTITLYKKQDHSPVNFFFKFSY